MPVADFFFIWPFLLPADAPFWAGFTRFFAEIA
jgi:hypothetical protein